MKTKSGSAAAMRPVLLWVILSLLLSVLSGCGLQMQSREGTELWIVTEQTTWDRMNGQLYVLKEVFEQAHPGVSVRVDVLPIDEQERAVRLQQLRTQILQGGGPDGYLLPTDNTLVLDEPAQYTYVEVEPLFVDVQLAMQNGLFYDITSLYGADDSLGKDGLNSKIMDAGVLDGTRYVLPLRYDMPVIYAEADALAEAGLDASVLTEDILTVMEAVLETGDPVLAAGILYDSFSAFSDFVDYGSGNTVLEEGTLTRYLRTYQQLQSLLGADILDSARMESEAQIWALATENTILLEKLDLKKYIYVEYGEPEPKEEIPDNVFIVGGLPIEEEKPDVLTEYFPLYVGSMADALAYAPLAKYQEAALTVVPMHAVGGDVVATVTYYAAVGSGCRNPELTYEFLRQFLLEESQWELNRPERNHVTQSTNTSNDLQYPGLIESGWPVRAENSVQSLWQVRRIQLYVRGAGFGASKTAQLRMRKIGLMGELEEERIPLMDVRIDQVRFNTTLSEEFGDVLAQLNDRDHANAPTDVDIRDLARQLIWDLRWHASEG